MICFQKLEVPPLACMFSGHLVSEKMTLSWRICKDLCVLAALVLNVQAATLPPYPAATPKDFLDPHNAARAQVKVAPLQWNTTLAAYALAQGQKQRDGDKCEMMEHSGTAGYGENLFWASHWDTTPEWAVQFWVSEREFYEYADNRCEPEFAECRHYTQIVWRASSQLGCAVVRCRDESTLTVCEYFPAGNVVGKRPY